MAKKKYADLKLDQLLADGWVKTEDPVFPFEKKIENTNPLNNSEDSDIKLVIHGMYNSTNFAVLLPDGGMLNFVANSLQELHEFEKKIMFYDPPF
jgi:hypothetical protein